MFDPIEEVIAAVGRGELVVLADDENRENEGDLICAGSLADAKMINFMVTWGRGILCAPMSLAYAARLGLKALPAPHFFHSTFQVKDSPL